MPGALPRGVHKTLAARKGLHTLLVAAVAVAMYLSPALALGLCAAGFVAILALRNHPYVEPVRLLHHKSLGDLLLPLGLAATILVVPDAASPTLAVPFLIVGIADPLATLVGTQYGRHRFRVFGEWRSAEGSAAFTLVSACVLLSATLSPTHALIGAAALTLVEILSVRGSDNLTLPLAALYLVALFA